MSAYHHGRRWGLPELSHLHMIEKSRLDWEDSMSRETEELSRRTRDVNPAEPDVFERLEAFSVGHQSVAIAKRQQSSSDVESLALERGMLMSKAALDAKSRALELLQRNLEDAQRALKAREQHTLALQRELDNQRRKRHDIARESPVHILRLVDDASLSTVSRDDECDRSSTGECEGWLRGSLSDAMSFCSSESNCSDGPAFPGSSYSYAAGHSKAISMHASYSSENLPQTADSVENSGCAMLAKALNEELREGVSPQTTCQHQLNRHDRRLSKLGDKRDGNGSALEDLRQKLVDVEGCLAEEQQFRQLAEDGVKALEEQMQRVQVDKRELELLLQSDREKILMLQSAAWHAKKEAEGQAWLRVQAEHNLQALRAGLQEMLRASMGARDGDDRKAAMSGAQQDSGVRSCARPWSTPSSPRNSYSWKVLIAAATPVATSEASRGSMASSSEWRRGRCDEDSPPGTPIEVMIASSSEDTQGCSRTGSSSSCECQVPSRTGRCRPQAAAAAHRHSSEGRCGTHALLEAGEVSSRVYANSGRESSSWGDAGLQEMGSECDGSFEWELPGGWSLGSKAMWKGKRPSFVKGGMGKNGTRGAEAWSPRSVGADSEVAGDMRCTNKAGDQAECEGEPGAWRWQDASADWEEDLHHGCMMITPSTSFTE